MNNYFKKRMEEIELRTEQMAEKKSYESEIDLLEAELKGFESNYQRLQTTCKSNLEELALKEIGLVVAKDAHAFSEDMLNKNRVMLVEEKRKLDNLHWQVWEEQIKACDEMGRSIADNDSVAFLNEYPRVLKTKKFAFLESQESNEELKKLVAEDPEIKELTAEIVALEIAIQKAEDGCLSAELQNILTEIRKFESNDNHNGEIQRLIEDLERSHCERMSLEAEISKKENRKIEVPNGDGKPEMSQKFLKDLTSIKTERQYCTLDCAGLRNDEQWLKNKLETHHHDDELEVIKERDKKLAAKKWYEDYAREIAVTNEDNCSKILYPPVSQLGVSNNCKQAAAQIEANENFSVSLNYEEPSSEKPMFSKREEKYGDGVDNAKFLISKGKFYPKNFAKRKNSEQSSQPLKSRFFDKKVKTRSNVGPGFLSTLKPISHFMLKKEHVDGAGVPRGTPDTNRKFEPLMATPSTFLKSAAEATLDNYSVQSSHDEKPSTSIQGAKDVKRSVKFTPKRPSNIAKKLGYHQTKLDDFDNFMLA